MYSQDLLEEYDNNMRRNQDQEFPPVSVDTIKNDSDLVKTSGNFKKQALASTSKEQAATVFFNELVAKRIRNKKRVFVPPASRSVLLREQVIAQPDPEPLKQVLKLDKLDRNCVPPNNSIHQTKKRDLNSKALKNDKFTKVRTESSDKTIVKSLFTSGLGQELTVSTKAMKKAKKRLHECNVDFKDISSSDKELSKNKDFKNHKKRLRTNIVVPDKPKSLFAYATGSKIKLSSEGLSKARESLSTIIPANPLDNNSTTSLFTYGNGTNVVINKSALKKAGFTLENKAEDQNCATGINNKNQKSALIYQANGKRFIVKKKKNMSLVAKGRNALSSQDTVERPIKKNLSKPDSKNLVRRTTEAIFSFLENKQKRLFSNKSFWKSIDISSCYQNQKVQLICGSCANISVVVTFFAFHDILCKLIPCSVKKFPVGFFILQAKLNSKGVESDNIFSRVVAKCLYQIKYKRISVIRKILEEGFSLNKMFVLKIHRVISEEWIILTDNWYLIAAKVNGKLKRYISNGRLFKDCYISVCGTLLANLSSEQMACAVSISIALLQSSCPLKIKSTPHLLISINCTKPLSLNVKKKYNIKLGEQGSTIFMKDLNLIELNSGLVSGIEGYITKIFDRKYYVKDSKGKSVFLCETELNWFKDLNERSLMDQSSLLNCTEAKDELQALVLKHQLHITSFIKIWLLCKADIVAEISFWNPPLDFCMKLKEGVKMNVFFLQLFSKRKLRMTFKTTKASFFIFQAQPEVPTVQERQIVMKFKEQFFVEKKYDKLSTVAGMFCHIVNTSNNSILVVKLMKEEFYISCTWNIHKSLLSKISKKIGQLICFNNVLLVAQDPKTKIFMCKSNSSSSFHFSRIGEPLGQIAKTINLTLKELRASLCSADVKKAQSRVRMVIGENTNILHDKENISIEPNVK